MENDANTKDEYETDHDEIESDEAIDNIKRLEEIKNKISKLLDDIRQIIKSYPVIYQRADAYWLAHIECALSKDCRYIGSSMVTMEDTIEEIIKIENKKNIDDKKIKKGKL